MGSNHKEDHFNCCDSGETNGGCTRTIKKNVGVVASLEVKPIVSIDESKVKIKCCGRAHVRKHPSKHSKKDECKFFIEQDICVHIPVQFDAKTELNALGIICKPEDQCNSF